MITNDGRNIVVCYTLLCDIWFRTPYVNASILVKRSIFIFFQGVLKGFDQATNIILDESHERVFSTKVSF